MAIYRPPRPKTVPNPTGTGYPASSLRVSSPQAADAGFGYQQSAPGTNVSTQGDAAAAGHNSYQQQPLATPSTQGGWKSSILSSIDARRKNARSALETGYRQTASDKAYSYDNSAIARKAAGDAYETGQADTQNAWQTVRDDTTSARGSELSKLDEELQNRRSTYAADDARALQDRNTANNLSSRMFGNAGSLRGLNFASTRLNADTNWDLGRLGVKERNRNAEDENLRQQANRGAYYDSTLRRQGEKSATDLRDLGNTYQSSLARTAADQANFDRSALLSNERIGLGYQDALTAASGDEARTMYDLSRAEAQDQAAREAKAGDASQAAADLAYKQAQTDLVRAQIAKESAPVGSAEARQADAEIKRIEAQTALYSAQAAAAARPSAGETPTYSETDIATARTNFGAKVDQLIPSKTGDGGLVGRLTSGLRRVDTKAIEDEIYRAFPGDSADAVRMRQTLARDANVALKNRGWSGVAVSGAGKPVEAKEPAAPSTPAIQKLYEYYLQSPEGRGTPLSFTEFMKQYGKYNQPSWGSTQ